MGTTGWLYIPQRLQVIFFSLLILRLLILSPGTVWAVDSATRSCPLNTHRYTAQLNSPHLTAVVGETVTLHFLLDPAKPPQGFFLSVNMNALQEPDAAKGKKPDILTGFPETSILFHAPGVYRYRVVVSLIAKSSCGGVKADTILNGEALIDVKP
jgi:hypothetical protein